MLKNTRYVGALSKKAESMPLIQKYMVLMGWPALSCTSEIMPANAPFSPACSMASTGEMVMKMPANSLATSAIGSKLNSLPARTGLGVMMSETTVKTSRMASRTRLGSG